MAEKNNIEYQTMDTTVKEPPVKRQRTSDDSSDDEITDSFCDPNNPRVLTFQDVSAAAYKVKAGIQHTPCTRSQMSSMFGMKVYFKKEFLQYTGSFKERGARYTLMMLSESVQAVLYSLLRVKLIPAFPDMKILLYVSRCHPDHITLTEWEQKKKGVIAASAGNHALALSYHGSDLGIPVTVVMPMIAPLMKIQNCKTHGATVIMKGSNINESKHYAMKLGKEKGLLYINGYDHPHILSGQGTMGLEIIEQVPDLDACIIPVGGGGLIAGSALAIKSLRPNVMIIGAESEKCPSFSEALKAGKPIYTPTGSTLADGLAVPTVGVNAFATAQNLIDKMVVVKEENIALSILRLLELEKAVVEGAGATGLAAVLEGHLPELTGKKVVIALCGGNIDTTALGRVIERGLAVDGRLVRFVVTVSDRPGGIAELTKILAEMGASIKDIFHERAWLRSDIFAVQVKCVCETRDQEHSDELEAALKKRYSYCVWGPVVF